MPYKLILYHEENDTQDIKRTYRLLVPLVHQVKENAMDEEQDVDNDKKVVWIPERIEAG